MSAQLHWFNLSKLQSQHDHLLTSNRTAAQHLTAHCIPVFVTAPSLHC